MSDSVPQPSALTDAIRALALAARVVTPAVGDLSAADYRVMTTIAAGEARASRLAARLGLGRPTVSATIESLSQRGLVVRTSVPQDNRAVALSLSADGVDLLAHVESRMARQLELLCERTPDAGRVIESLSWLGAVIETSIDDRVARAERLDAVPPSSGEG